MEAMKFIDIGANLLDEMYSGRYNDKDYHPPDLDGVLKRSWEAGVEKMIITAGTLEEAEKALELARRDERLFCTVGVHPTRCNAFEQYKAGPEAYLAALQEVLRRGAAEGKVVAVGECGLDYDRLHFCDAETQRKYFEWQFQLAAVSGLPLFLHLRGAAAADFVELLRRHSPDFTAGVVHSFNGTLEDLQQLLQFDNLSIGINGCSLKTEENLHVMARVPSHRLMLETDCPWCGIRSTHAGSSLLSTIPQAKDKKKHDPQLQVKGRNEPCNIRQVLEVVAGFRQVEDVPRFAQAIFDHTESVFFPPRS